MWEGSDFSTSLSTRIIFWFFVHHFCGHENVLHYAFVLYFSNVFDFHFLFCIFMGFLNVVAFEHRALHLLSRRSTTWAMPPALYDLAIFLG
jgi:hypothetical protein